MNHTNRSCFYTILAIGILFVSQASAFQPWTIPEFDRPDCLSDGEMKIRATRYETNLRFCPVDGKLKIWDMNGPWLRAEVSHPVLISSSDQSLMDSYKSTLAIDASIRALQELRLARDNPGHSEVTFGEIVAITAQLVGIARNHPFPVSKKKLTEVTIMSLETNTEYILRFPANDAHLLMKALRPSRHTRQPVMIPSQDSVSKL